MRSYTQNFLRILFLVGFVASFAVWQRHENQWDYLVFTQQWPVAVCIDINVSKLDFLYIRLLVTVHLNMQYNMALF